MAKKPRYGTWMKNFGQSVKFSAKSVLTDMAPTVSETRETLQNDIHELRQQLQANRNVKQALLNYLDPEGNVQKYAKEAIDNTKKSLRTGKFYDARREDKAMGDAFGFDDDFDFGDMDGGSDDMDFGSVKMGPDKVMDELGPAMSSFGESVGKGIGETNKNIARGFNALNEAEKGRMAMTMAINEKYYSASLKHLSAIEENSAAMVKFNNETMSVYAQGALKYYEDSLSIMKEIRDAVVPKKGEERKGFQGDGLDDVFSGGFSLSNYLKTVKKQFGSYIENSPMGMLSMLADPMFLSSMAANPLAGLLSFGIGSLIPSRLKKSIGRTDTTFKEFMPALFDKIGRYSGNNDILDALSQIFGIKRGTSRDKFATNEYNKGAISYDGESKKAITEVIPSYLSRILYTLEKMSGVKNPAQLIYDWSDDSTTGGRFITLDDLKNRHKDSVKRAKLSGFSDATWEFDDKVRELFGGKSSRTTDFKDSFRKMLIDLVDNDTTFNPRDIKYLKRFFGPNEKSDIYARMASDIIRSMSNASQMSIAGSGRMDSRGALAKYYYDNMGTGQITNVKNNLYGGIYDPAKVGDTKYFNDDSGLGIYKDSDGKWNIPIDKLREYNRKYKTKFKNAEDIMKDYSKRHNLNTADQSFDVIMAMQGMTDEERQAFIKSRTSSSESNDDNRFSSAIGRFFRKPLDFIESGLTKIDNLMYKVIFSMDDEDNSIFKNVVDGIKNTFKKVSEWLEKNIFNPIKDRILGSEIAKKAKNGLKSFFLGDKDSEGKYSGGLFSAVINSGKDLWGDVKKEWNENVFPKIKGLGDDIRQYIFGEDKDKDQKEKKPIMESIMDKLSEGFNWWSSVLFGKGPDADEDTQKKSGRVMMNQFKKAMPKAIRGGIVGTIGGTISGLGGFGIFGSLFLPGGPIGGAIVGSALGFLSQSNKFKELLFGKEETNEDGTTSRAGGLISKDIQNFFKKNKINIIGGAAIGTGSYLLTGSMAFGLMPGLAIGAFGPVIAGAAMGVATHSNYLKKLLFGDEEKQNDGTMKRVGGIINGDMMARIKKAMPRAAVGALGSMAGFTVLGNMGLVGSMLALGPIPAALLGAGFGILSSSKDFTDSMFGYTDEKGEYHEGVLGKMRNFFMLRIFEPLQIASKELFEKGSNWFKRNIALPLASSFLPLKVAAEKIGDNIIDRINKAMNTVGEGLKGVFSAIGQKTMQVFDKILSPLQRLGRSIASIIGSGLGLLFKATMLPLRAAGGLANLYVKGGAVSKSLTLTAGSLMSPYVPFHNPFDLAGTGDKYYNKLKAGQDRLKAEKEQAEIEKKSLKNDFSDQWKDLEKRQKEGKLSGWSSSDIKKEKKRLQTIQNNINTTTDPNVALNQAQLNEQVEMNTTLKDIRNKVGNMDKPDTGPSVEGIRGADNNAVIAADNVEKEEREELSTKADKSMIEFVNNMNGNSDAAKNPNKPENKFSVFGMIRSITDGITGLLDFVGIGAGILGILGLIWGFISGETDNPQTQEAIKNSQAYGRLQRHGANAIGRITVGAARVGKSALDAGETAYKAARKSLDSIPDSVKGKIGENIGKPLEAAGQAVGKRANGFAETMKAGIEKIFSTDGVLSKITNSRVISTIKGIFTGLVDAFAKPSIFGKILKAGGKVTGALIRTVGGAATGGLLSLGFGIYDAVTGFTRTAELFDVADEDVDWTMRAISTLLNVITGLPGFVFFDVGMSLLSIGAIAVSGTTFGQLLAQFGYPLTGFDHHKIIARIIYDLITDEGTLDAKQANKQNRIEEANKALNKEYDRFLKDNGLTDKDFSREEFGKQAEGSMWNKYIAPTLSKITGVSAYETSANKPQTLLERLTYPYQRIVDYFTGFAKRLWDFGFLGMAKLILGLETEESLTEKAKDPEKAHELSLFERIKYFFRGNRTEQEALRRAGFSGSGFEDEQGSLSATVKNKAADTRDKSTIPYYWTQNDPRYADAQAAPNADSSFGSIGQVGCAPTALAMVASMFNGYPISPKDVAVNVDRSDLFYKPEGLTGKVTKGINSSFFGKNASKYNLNMQKNIYSADDMKRELLAGKALILGGTKLPGQTEFDSPFTTAGHYVVAKGFNPNRNTVSIYDPLGKNTRSYNINSLMTNLKFANSFAASFSGTAGSPGSSGGAVGTDNSMALNPEVVKLPYSVQTETGEVNINALTKNAKEAMEYMAKYHRYLTGRNMIVSSGYRTSGTMGDHATGNCFDVVDDANHRTLELNEDNIRTKMKQEAGRVGIKVLDEYEIDTPYKTAGHLHMDATNWQNKPFNNLGSSAMNSIKKGLKTIADFMGSLGTDFMKMAMATFAGRRYIPGEDGDGMPYSTGSHSITPKEVYTYLKGKGYDDAAIAGILANIEAESNFDASDRAEHKAGDGYTYGGLGLFQWNGGRTEALKKWAAETGRDYQDAGTQLDYMIKEAAENSVTTKDLNLYDDNADGAAAAAYHFADKFERCAEQYKAPRKEKAMKWFTKIQSGEFSGAGPGIMSNLTSSFAARNHITPSNIIRFNRNNNRISESHLSPNSIINTAMNQSETLMAIRSLDNHSELARMIELLELLVKKEPAVVNGSVPLTDREKRKTKEASRNISNSRELNRMIDSFNANDNRSRDSIEIAYEIARGGKFRQR